MTRQTPRVASAVEALRQQGALTLQEAATFSGVSLSTLRRAISNRELDAHYPTSRPVVLRRDLDEWLRSGALSLDHAAVYVSVSRRTLNEIIARGALQPRYPSRRPVLLRAELDAWLESLPTEPPVERAA